MDTFNKETLSVGQVSDLMGVSVRTLHHFEDKGLINPARTTKGYRVYSAHDIDRLQQILVYRSLDFSLESIGRIIDDGEALEAACAQALRDGVVPGSDAANELVEQHRASINRYFDCSYSQQVLIAKSYVADPRFTAHYDEREPGLAQWIHDAILANAATHGIDVESPEWV